VLDKPSILHDKSTHSRLLFSLGGVSFTATLISQPRNGSLLQLNDPEFRDYVGKLLFDLRVGQAYAPKPKFTDRICTPSDLTMGVQAGPYVLHRTPDGEFGDGVILNRGGDSYLVSPSNCPTTIMVGGNGLAVAAHMGRFCLIDEQRFHTSTPAVGRKHMSIVSSALELLGDPKAVHAKVFWGIAPNLFPHDMEHPEFGDKNEWMRSLIARTWGESSVQLNGSAFYLDLPKLIRDQCMNEGVPERNIDLRCAYQPNSGTWTDGALGKPRNLVIVTRKS